MTIGRDPLGISVVLPVFIRDPSLRDIAALRRSLESVLDQRFPGPREIVLVDDGSDAPIDAYASLIGAAFGQVRYIRHPTNQGVAAALNTGLRTAGYDLIARIDADDRWLAGKLDAQLSLLQDPDVTLAATGMVRVQPTGEEIDRHHRPSSWSGILDFLCEVGCPFPHASVLARRSVFDLLGGYPRDARFMHCEDLALWGVWLRFFRPAMVSLPLLEHVVSPTSVSAIHSESQRLGTRIVMQRLRDLDLAATLPRALSDFSAALGCSLFEAGTLAYQLWKHPRVRMRMPLTAIEPLAAVLPDRDVCFDGGEAALDWRRMLARPEASGTARRIVTVQAVAV